MRVGQLLGHGDPSIFRSHILTESALVTHAGSRRLATMVAIRSAGLADVAGILELWRDADVVPGHTDDVAGLEQLIRHDPCATLVAESGGRIIGSVIAAWDGWRGSVYRLAVAAPHRRTGLGRRLVAEAERRLEAAGARRLQAVVVESDPGATGFWRATGWDQQIARVRFVKG